MRAYFSVYPRLADRPSLLNGDDDLTVRPSQPNEARAAAGPERTPRIPPRADRRVRGDQAPA